MDGYPGTASIWLGTPNIAFDAGGRLWFVGTEGIGSVDPRRLYRNRLAPPVQIVDLAVDGQRYRLDRAVRLVSGSGRLNIRFAALGLTSPEQLQLRYRLEGVDTAWQQAGLARSVSYDNLAPGYYRFAVKAANEDGVWNEAGATLNFEVTPRFTQTVWFYLLCLGAVGGLGYVLYALRMRQVVRGMNALLKERLRERERIARALHDSLLQSVQGLILLFQGVNRKLPAGSDTRARMEAVLVQADTVMSEGRDTVMGLRRSMVSGFDLGPALGQLGAVFENQFGVPFSLRATGQARPLRERAAEEIYFIGHEALCNAYRHAGARHIELELDYGADRLSLLVRDDGRGIAPEVRQAGGKAGHWGLVGMRERAASISAGIEFGSPPAGGTQVRLHVPASRAYAVKARLRLWQRLRAGLSRGRLHG
nr:triple tyrosine motif-containing protein [Rugamonas sp. CCM 8940]